MSSFRDLVKKVNEEKKTVSASGQKKPKEEEKKSSFRDLVSDVNNGTIKMPSVWNSSDVENWYKGAINTGKKAYDHLSIDGYKKSDELTLKEIDSYLANADYVGQYLNYNKGAFDNYDEVVKNYNDIVSYLKTLQSGLANSNKYFSKFASADDYERLTAGWLNPEAETNEVTSSKRKAYYQKNVDRIEEIKSELPGIGNTFLPTFIEKWFLSDEEEALKDEMESRKAENLQYKRTQGTLDEYYTPVTPEFQQNAAYRDYINPTREELHIFDSNRRNSDEQIFSWDGENYRDQNGNIVQYSNDPGIQDKLGMFLTASDEDIAAAYDELSTGLGDGYHTWAGVMQEGDVNGWKHLKENEIDIYYDLYKRKGQEAAYRYLDDMTTELTRRATQEMTDYVNEAPLLEQIALNAASIPATVFGGIPAFIDDMSHIVQGEDINPYSRAHLFTNVATDVRSKTATDIENLTGNVELPWVGTSFGDVYQSLMSAADSLVGSAIGGKAYGLFMGMGAASNEMRDLYEKGADINQIAAGGILAGAAEMIFEKISIDHLVKIGDSKTIKDAIFNYLKQAGVEASEEVLTEIANTISNVVVMGSKSDWVDAETFAKNVVNAGIGGFISGGASSSVFSAASYAKNDAQFKADGRTIMKADGTNALMDLANEVAGVSGPKVQNGITKQVNKVSGKMDAKSTIKSTARQVGRLYDSVKTAYSTQNHADIAKTLERSGFSANEANQIAGAVIAEANGLELTKKQSALLDRTRGVVGKVLNKDMTAISQREQKLGGFEADVTKGLFSKTVNEQAKAGAAGESGNGNLPTEVKSLPESHYEVSEEGKTIDSNGNDIVIKGVKSVANGKMILETEDGTIDASEVAYASQDEALVYSFVSDMGVSADTAWSLIKNFRKTDGVSAEVYARDIPLAYMYGKLNYRAGLNKLSDTLTVSQRMTAFYRGRADADAEVKSKAATKPTSTKSTTVSEKSAEKEIIFEGFAYDEKTARPLQKASIAAIDVINKVSNLEVHVYQSVKKDGKYYANVNGKLRLAPNGYFTDGNKIYIDINAGNKGEGAMLFTMAHEVGHYIAELNAEDFKAISDFLFEHYGEDVPIYDLLEAQKEKLIKSYKTDGKTVPSDTVLEKEAQEELVCDMLSRMFADQNAYDVLMELKQQDLNLFQKLGQAIKKLLDKLKNLFGVYDNQTPDFKYAASVENFGEEAFRRLQEMYMRAFVKADANIQTAEKNTTEGGGQVRYEVREEFATELREWFKNTTHEERSVSGKRFLVGTTSETLKSIGVKDYDIYIGGSKIDKILEGNTSMTLNTIADAVLLLDSPILIMKSLTVKNSIVLFGEVYTSGDKPVMISVLLYPETKSGEILDYAVITSAYGRTANNLQNMINKAKIYYVNEQKNRTDEWLKALGLQLPSAITKYGPIDTIEHPNPIVKNESSKALVEKVDKDTPESAKRSDRDYSYEALTRKPDMVVTTVDGNVQKNRADVVALAKKNAAKVGKFNTKTGSVSVYVKDIGKDVVLGTIGLKHGLDGRRTENSIVTVKAGEILQNSIRINELTPKKEEAYGSYVLIGAARSDSGDLYIVRSVVNTFKNELMSMDVLYAINAKKGNRLRSMRPGFQGPVTDSTISIAKLLDDVNNYFPDILPEEVLKHYGHDARPEGELGESALYQERDPDSVSNRSLLANAFENVAQNEIEKQKIQEYKEKISFIDAEEQKLHELNEEIKKLSFAKGPRDTKAIQKLQLEAKQTANRISIYDNQLLRLEGSKPLQDVLSRERAKAFKRGKEKGRESLERYRDRRSRSVVAAKIKAFKQRLEQSLLRPTDGQYIPIDLVNAMVDVCNIINTDTSLYKADGSLNKAQMQRDLTKEKLQNLKDEYEKLKTHSDPIYAGEFDEMVYAYITNLRDNFSGKSLKDMSLDELQEMYETLVAIEETLRDARKLIGWGDADGVYEAGDAIVAEQNKITRDRKNGKRNAFGKANDAALNLSLSPVRNVERMSGYNQDSYLLKLFKKFEQGVRKKNMFTMEAYKLFEHLTSGKVYEDAIYKEVGGKKYTDIKGRKFAVSKMQMMQAILSYEREQANKNLHHIEQDGFTFADLDLLKKGNVAQAISAEHSHRTPASVGLVAEFIDVLKDDKWCQDYMEASRKFFNEKAKDAINEATIATKHRIIAKEKNYIPFEVDRNFVAREISAENSIQQTINSYGMLKETQNNAPQPLIITGLNNVIDRHIDMVGNVYGLAVEVRNFNKVWNVRSFNVNGNNPTVKEVIETNWGKGGVKHIEQAVQDIQGPRVREKSAITALHEKAKSGYIGATFLLNLSVVTKQIGSLYSATSMLRWRDPARQLGNLIYTMANHKKIAAEVDKYTATAWMRRQGLSDAELHALMSEGKKTWLGRVIAKAPAIVNPTKWITAMDHAVALSLWRFAKIDTAKKTGLKGEELLKATAAFYDDVVENTQSMTDVLHRPEIQKSKNVFAESFAMFKTDLYQMAGQLHVTAGRFFANKSKENGKALGRTLYSIAMSAVWGQLMTTVFALLRYKVNPYRDDEDKDITTESWLKRQGISFVGDILGYIFPIFGSEIAGSFEDVVYGESDGVVGSLAADVLNDLYDTMITVGAAIKDGEMPEPAALKKLVAKVLQVFGVPANNILRTWEAIKLHAKDIANGEFFSFEAGADRSPKHHIHRIIEAVNEGKTAVAISLYEEALEEIATKNADGEEFGEDETNEAKASLKTALGNKYKSGEVTKETTTKILSNVFGMSNDDIYWTFDKWDYAKENGTSDDYGKYEEFYAAVETGKNLQTVIKKYTDNGVKESTLRSEISKNFKPQYMEMSTSERTKIRGYLLDAMTELGTDQRNAENTIGEWEFEADHPELKDRVTYTQYQRWEADGKPKGVSIDMFIDVAEFRDPGTSDSVRDQDEVAQYISSVTTDRRMRHALWCCFYKASTSPWR